MILGNKKPSDMKEKDFPQKTTNINMLSPQNHHLFFRKGKFFIWTKATSMTLGGFKLLPFGGGNSNIFGIFTPEIGEEFFPFWGLHMFQMGWWTNHQAGWFFEGWDRPTTWPNVRCGMSEARTRSVLCGAIITKAKLLRFGTFWDVFLFFFGLPFVQLMVSCWVVWFGARWFGIGIGCPSTNPFHKGILGIQTTAPQTNN